MISNIFSRYILFFFAFIVVSIFIFFLIFIVFKEVETGAEIISTKPFEPSLLMLQKG